MTMEVLDTERKRRSHYRMEGPNNHVLTELILQKSHIIKGELQKQYNSHQNTNDIAYENRKKIIIII